MKNDSNLHGWDYRAKALELGAAPVEIIDAHAHVVGVASAAILREAMKCYGIGEVWSMTPSLDQLEPMRELFEGRIRFIAVPDWRASDKLQAHGRDFARRIREFHARGARIAKFWSAPRGVDIGLEHGVPDLMRLDHPERIAAMETAHQLGMEFMVHIADPDTWFATKYADASKYGSKAAQYEPLERMLDRFPNRWIAAHMGGSPEDLAFLDGLLSRHANLHLDTSATKWIVREVSRHDPAVVRAFFARWRTRLIFGSDIVTSDAHLSDSPTGFEMDAKANSRQSAFDLYASRYWALRTLWESDWCGISPIADPDLHMVWPGKHGPHDSPTMRGVGISTDLLRDFYERNARTFIGV